MRKDEREVTLEKDTMEEKPLSPEIEDAGWFTKLARIERAKAVRRQTRKARKGKRITFSGPGGWSQKG